MNGFKIGKFIIVCIDADAEKQASISPVYNLVVSELGYGSAPQSGCGRRSTPRQSLIGTSGLVGQLSGALLHVTEPNGDG